MRKHGYPDGTSAGLIASGGIIAPIIPPSMPFVIYGVTTNTSISQLFLSGIVPGLIMGVGLVVVWKWHRTPASTCLGGKPLPWPQRRSHLLASAWALLMPVIIIGGMKIGAVHAHRSGRRRRGLCAVRGHVRAPRDDAGRCLPRAGAMPRGPRRVVMFLCGAATAACYMITLADLPMTLAGWLGPLARKPADVHGGGDVCSCWSSARSLDLTPTILILAPVMLPMAVKAGIDPVYFGLMFVFVGCLGLITPPVGTVLNVVAGVGGLRMAPVIKGVTPFLLIYFAMLALLLLFPAIVLWPLER